MHKRSLSLKDMFELGFDALQAHRQYKQLPKNQNAEFAVDRVLYGILFERYRSTSKKTPQSAVRQSPVHKTKKRSARIDFLVGGRSSGTFFELAVRTHSNPRGAYHKSNSAEIHKLSKVSGYQRYLLILDTTTSPLSADNLYRDYGKIPGPVGKNKHRNCVSVVYVSRPGDGCAFTWDPKRPKGAKTARLKIIN